MPFEVREIVLQAQVVEDEAEAQAAAPEKAATSDDQGCGSDASKSTQRLKAELRAEMRQMIREELDRRARR